MVNPKETHPKLLHKEEIDDNCGKGARLELANRVFFRLYQCANILHKTGTKAVEKEGLTTQQWAVLGALSRPNAKNGISINELAQYLLVSRQNLSGVISRMERNGHISIAPDGNDRRSRLVKMTEKGLETWALRARPLINDFYDKALEGFSINDLAHTLHYLLKLLDNMENIDNENSKKQQRK